MNNHINSYLRLSWTEVILCFFVITASSNSQQRFTVDIKDRSDDMFKVTLIPEKLSSDNNIFQFASTAPGTYQEMDIGRFVRSFKAYDDAGNVIKSDHISLNQWKLSSPENIRKIIYNIEDTWDTPVDSNPVYPMSGSTIEEDNVMINGQCVFGYFKGMQSEPVKVKIEYPENWIVGTALEKDEDGFYTASNFDQIVDSPFLLGNLSTASVKVNSTEVDVFTYSKSGSVTSDKLLNSIKDILSAEDKFMEGLPVKRYAFLFHFENATFGAWEHSYSSDYVFQDQPLTENYIKFIRTIVSHEFFHILTPLNIHSQLVEKFNFERPVMSEHLWLYEGVTEWAANIIELRDNLIDLNEYLNRMTEKLNYNDQFNKNLSLTELSINSYKLQDQYVNIYQRGAVIAGLLDLRLLELSKGKMGLREVLVNLSKKYGPKKAFDENTFFDEFTKETFPEIGDFFNRYVKGTEKLPIQEYYNKIGIEYKDFAGYDSSNIRLGLQLGLINGNIAILNVMNEAVSSGAQKGDLIIKIQGDTLNLQNAQQRLFALKNSSKIGDEIRLTILRNNQPKELKIKLMPAELKHIFRIIENPSEEQKRLKEIWLKNL